jgi:two-component system, OmpR family, sensor histidine kinase CiaH
MTTDKNRKRLVITTAVFWILLIYIVSAIIWWYFLLRQQTDEIYTLQKQQVQQAYPDTTSTAYRQAYFKIQDEKRRNDIKYVGEGVIFLLLIIFGAVYIYRSVRRQLGLQRQQQNFVMAVTHELKTPISVARLNLETLKRYQLDAQKQQKLIDTSLQETLRLDMLINNILISSQLDGKAYRTSKEEMDFSDLLKSEVKQFQNRYPERQLQQEIEPDVVIVGDGLLLKLLISNLLENANKYSAKEKPITVQLHHQNGKTELEVADEGLGIADLEKGLIFQKFYRIGNEQTRTAKGTGLGLYICKQIAEAHHATIQVTDNLPQGSNFTVHFNA